jgi:hypothetical protein
MTGTDFERGLDAEAERGVDRSWAAAETDAQHDDGQLRGGGATPARASAQASTDSVAADLRIARVLLRGGNALAARVQLETLVGRRQLDLGGMLDLAESRWRTGDLDAAGEAVTAYLEAGGSQPLGFLIAAEATAAVGRPGEARKFARQALQDLNQPLDAIFAGQPRSSIWPHDPAETVQPAGTLFASAGMDAAHGGRIGLTTPPGGSEPQYGGRASSHADRALTNLGAGTAGGVAGGWVADSDAQPEFGLWDQPQSATAGAWTGDDADMSDGAASDATGQTSSRPDVRPELDAARAALAAGDTRGAAMQLSVVLRRSPGLAPAVLDLVGQLPGVDLDLVRGDALRLVGREAAAERAYASAANALRGRLPETSTDATASGDFMEPIEPLEPPEPIDATQYDPTRSPE